MVGYWSGDGKDKTAETCLDVDLTTQRPGERGGEFVHMVLDQKIVLSESEAEAFAALYCLMGFEHGDCFDAVQEIAKQAFFAGFRIGRNEKNPLLIPIE